MRNEVLSGVTGSFGALFLALKLSKMIFSHLSVAGASSSVHGCLFNVLTSIPGIDNHDASMVRTKISFILLFYCVISWLLANKFQFIVVF
jgi:hypothetical protein